MKQDFKKDVKRNAKRGAIIIICLIPFLFIFGLAFYFSGLPNWAQIMLIAATGILLYIVVEIVYARISAKREKYLKENPPGKVYDPFAD